MDKGGHDKYIEFDNLNTTTFCSHISKFSFRSLLLTLLLIIMLFFLLFIIIILSRTISTEQVKLLRLPAYRNSIYSVNKSRHSDINKNALISNSSVLLLQSHDESINLPENIELWISSVSSWPINSELVLVIGLKNGATFHCYPQNSKLKKQQWNNIVYNTRDDSKSIRCVTHPISWSGSFSRYVNYIGVKLITPNDWTGIYYVAKPSISNILSYPSRVKPIIEVISPQNHLVHTSYNPIEFSFNVIGIQGLNPFDMRDIKINLNIDPPYGNTFTRPCFYYQDFALSTRSNDKDILFPIGNAKWKVNFTPFSAGIYRCHITLKSKHGESCSKIITFKVVGSNPKHYVNISINNPKSFELANKKPFFPIGLHLSAPFPDDMGVLAYERYFKNLSNKGGNTAIIWMSNWALGLEWGKSFPGYHGLNEFRLDNAWRIDHLFKLAEIYNIYLIFKIDSHGNLSTWVNPQWETNPISRFQGGPCSSPEEFFTSENSFEIYANRLRYIMARWGHHPRLFGWLLLGEINLCGSSKKFLKTVDTTEFINKTTRYINKENALRRPITIQYAGDMSAIEPTTACNPNVSFLVFNAYNNSKFSLLDIISKNIYKIDLFNKPVFIAEYGSNFKGNDSIQNFVTDFHDGLWASQMTNMSGAPMFWWHDLVDQHNWYNEIQSISNYNKHDCLIYENFSINSMECKIESNSKVKIFSKKTSTKAYMWIVDPTISYKSGKSPKINQYQIVVKGMDPGNYIIEYWDTSQGLITESRHLTISSAKQVALNTIPFAHDVAIKLYKSM